uniref:Uncharacterized protein n=1 Tax=Anguilla anguilla TaxID=7936 RepID=A0A0E9R6F6_ANGAN
MYGICLHAQRNGSLDNETWQIRSIHNQLGGGLIVIRLIPIQTCIRNIWLKIVCIPLSSSHCSSCGTITEVQDSLEKGGLSQEI